MNCCRPFNIFLIMAAAMSSLGDTSGLYMILVTAFYGLIFVEMYCCIQLESAYKEYSDHMKVKSLLSYKNWNKNNGSVNFKHYQKSKNLWPACIRLKGPTRRKCHISPSIISMERHKKPIIRIVGSETLSFPEVHTVHCAVPKIEKETRSQRIQATGYDHINKDIKSFSTTTDIRSSRTMESFMALTLHSLTEDFHPINFTLAVEPLRGRHTASFIKKSLEQQFECWGLNKEFLVVMHCDNASNVIKIFNHLNRYTSHLNDCVSLFIL